MKVVGWKHSMLAGDTIIAQIMCERCGHIGSASCKKLSELHTCICNVCGYLNMEKDGSRMYKEASELIGDDERKEDKSVHRSGIARMIREFNSMKRKGKVDTTVFPDKETFVRWSVEHGYRDWKVLKVNKATGLVDNGAYWSASSYGVNVDSSKIKSADEAKEILTKCVGVALCESREKIDETLTKFEELEEKYKELKEVEGFGLVKNNLLKVMRELEKIEDTVDMKLC